MSELRGEVAVVGEQKHAGGVAVETSYRIDAFVAGSFYEVHYSETPVGVIACSDAVFRFVEQNVAFALKSHNLAIVFDNVAVCDFCAEFGHYLAVYLDQSLLDEFVGFAARAYAGVAHIFVKTNLLVGVKYGHFVFDAFGARCEALAAAGETVVIVLVRTAVVIVFVVSSLLVLAVVTSLLTVVVTALSVIVVSAVLLTVVVASLTVISALLVVVTSLTVVVTSLVLTVVAVLSVVGTVLAVVAVLSVVRSGLTWLIGALILLCSFSRLLAFGSGMGVGCAFGSGVVVGVLRTVIVVAVVASLIVIRAWLIGPSGTEAVVIGRSAICGCVVAGIETRTCLSTLVGRAERLPDAWALRFLFVRIGIHISWVL